MSEKPVYRETPCNCGRNMFVEIDMVVEDEFGNKHVETFEYCVDCHTVRVPFAEVVKEG